MAKTTEKTEKAVSKFLKSQLVKAKKYSNNVDLVNALLEDGKKYSIDEVDTLIDKYMKGKVN